MRRDKRADERQKDVGNSKAKKESRISKDPQSKQGTTIVEAAAFPINTDISTRMSGEAPANPTFMVFPTEKFL